MTEHTEKKETRFDLERVRNQARNALLDWRLIGDNADAQEPDLIADLVAACDRLQSLTTQLEGLKERWTKRIAADKTEAEGTNISDDWEWGQSLRARYERETECVSELAALLTEGSPQSAK